MRIDDIVKRNMCISCGMCMGACPQQCIKMSYMKGMFLPHIDETICTKCGICEKICPGKGCDYKELGYSCVKNYEDLLKGKAIVSYNMKVKDETWLLNATSGGVVTRLVYNLLNNHKFDCAFLVDTNNYGEELFSVKYSKMLDNRLIAKSRYLPVNHINAVKYILKNRNKKVILVGTSCFAEALRRIIKLFKLNEDQYFIIGLFCDKVMNYNVWDYFKMALGKDDIKGLDFRNKKYSGWPGDGMVYCADGEKSFDKNMRMEVKDYFVPERCLYCLDKLNIFADISVGDNYTGTSDGNGSSSVIIRTKQGRRIIDEQRDDFIIEEDNVNNIAESQQIKTRWRNYKFSKIKEVEENILINIIPQVDDELKFDDFKIKKEFSKAKKNIKIGQNIMATYYRVLSKHNKGLKRLFYNIKSKWYMLKRLVD